MSISKRSDVFDDLWSPFDHSFVSSLSVPSNTSTHLAFVRVNWKETPEAHVFKADLPGLRADEVTLEVEGGNTIQISGEFTQENEQKTFMWHRMERPSGKFLRRFRLPKNAKMDEIEAFMKNGVLTVTVPTEEVKKPEVKSIEVSA